MAAKKRRRTASRSRSENQGSGGSGLNTSGPPKGPSRLYQELFDETEKALAKTRKVRAQTSIALQELRQTRRRISNEIRNLEYSLDEMANPLDDRPTAMGMASPPSC